MTTPLIKSFQIYYGPLTAPALQELQKVDLCILEPRYADQPSVRALRAAGTLVLGYLSVMETPAWNSQRFTQLDKQDFWLADGHRVHFAAWDSYLMDLRRPHYRDLLLQEVQQWIVEPNLDGVFLDTVGDLEEYIPQHEDAREQMERAYLDLLQRLRIMAPQLYLLQNRGFSVLRAALPYLQGILWEGWRGDLVEDPWVQERLRLLDACAHPGLQRFAVTASPAAIHADAARRHGFVHLTRSSNYHLLDTSSPPPEGC